MPRYFNNLAEAQAAVGGYKSRNAASAAERAKRAAMQESPEKIATMKALRAIRVNDKLKETVREAEEHASKLRAKLAAAKRQKDNISERAYSTGDVQGVALKVRATIEMLPAAIDRADEAVNTARQALADYVEQMSPPASVETSADTSLAGHADDDASGGGDEDPVIERRGRGRPRKAEIA